MISINMRSSANCVKSQGVGSCYDEQVALVKDGLENCTVSENKRGRYDLVHYHTVNPHYYLERLWSRASTVGIGYVHFLPETLDESLRLPAFFRKLFYRYLLDFYNSMDYLVTVNPYFVERIRAYGIDRPEVTCIPNFVSARIFHPMRREELREEYAAFGIPDDKFIVLGVGQLQTRKGVADFIETAKACPDAHFVWAGGFSFGRISQGYEEIKALVASPPANVTFLGIVQRERMPLLYNLADVMFLPSYDELFPMAILEAVGCGIPVLVRDIPLYDQVLFDYCMREDNVAGFASWILRLMDSPKSHAWWKLQAMRCHHLYSEESALAQWREFYQTAYQQCVPVKGKGVSKRNGKRNIQEVKSVL